MRKTSAKAFTLVELLMVISVIAVLVALVAAGTGSARSRDLNRAGSLVADMAAQASRIAKTRNSLSALVVVTEGEVENDNYRLLTIMERSIGEASWKQVSKWEKLPEGIVVDQREAVSTFLKSAPSPPDPAPSTLRRASSYAYQVFLPDGRILNSENPVLYLREEAGGESAPNFYEVTLNANTGTPIIRRP